MRSAAARQPVQVQLRGKVALSSPCSPSSSIGQDNRDRFLHLHPLRRCTSSLHGGPLPALQDFRTYC